MYYICVGVHSEVCLCVCVSFQVASMHSEVFSCILQREHEKCMEKIALHDPDDDLEYGMGLNL